MTESLHPIETKILSAWNPSRWEGISILVAVSGGPDSIALARALLRLKSDSTRLIVAHFNHRSRGEQSDLDETFVRDFASLHDLPCLVASHSGTLSTKPRAEATLREERYHFLEKAVGETGSRCVMTGHTADDQVETVLHHLFRGSGLVGLSGIPVSRLLKEDFVIVRPIRECWREEILNYLAALDQPYRIDTSNLTSDIYRRNWLRNQLLPSVCEQYSQEAKSAILRASQIIRESVDLIESLSQEWANQHLKRVCFETNGQSIVSYRWKVSNQPMWMILQSVLYTIWKNESWPMADMNHSHWQDIRKRLYGIEPDWLHQGMDLPNRIRFERDDDEAILEGQKTR